LSEREEFYDYPDPWDRRFAASYPSRTPYCRRWRNFMTIPIPGTDTLSRPLSEPRKVAFLSGDLPLELPIEKMAVLDGA
jgi:hypothetical protein